MEEGDLDWTAIKVPRGHFGEFGEDSNIYSMVGISGFTLTDNHFECLQRSCEVRVLLSEGLRDFDHVDFSVSVDCCHESCFELMEYD